MTIKTRVVVDQDLLLAGAREEHAVDFVAVGAVQADVLPVECLHQDVLSLVKSTEDEVVTTATAATALGASPYSKFQVLCQVDQRLNVPLVGLVLDNDWDLEALEKLLDVWRLCWRVRQAVHFVEEVPE